MVNAKMVPAPLEGDFSKDKSHIKLALLYQFGYFIAVIRINFILYFAVKFTAPL